jgi:hypothetical protein
VSRYVCVADQKVAGFPVTAACEIAEVSTSGFYDWCQREAAPPTERQLAEAALVELIREIFDAADGNYGVPRIHRELRDHGVIVNIKRVRRLMRLHGMAGRCVRRRCRTTFPGPDGYTIPDLVGRAFTPGRPDWAWCQDITYVWTGEGWLYLASVIDIGSRRLLGYSMADHMRTELVTDALDMAIAARAGHAAGVIAHADRGSQGGFNWSSQHLDDGGECWGRTCRGRCVRIGGRSRRRVGRRSLGGGTVSGSGLRSLGATRPRTPRSRLGCHRQLRSGGSVTLVA